MENLQDRLSSLSIANNRKSKLLLVDLRYYSGKFWPEGSTKGNQCSMWPSPAVVEKKVKEFINAAKKNGYTIEVYEDSHNDSETWRERRIKEIKEEYRNIPGGANQIVCDIFTKSNITVYRSIQGMARRAHEHKCDILSKDESLCRYKRFDYQHYFDFFVKNGNLILKPYTIPRNTIRDKDINDADEIPRETTRKWATYERFGNASPLTKELGNIHLTVRPLRQAVYARLGITGSITEEIPVWDSKKGQVEFLVEQVKPDSKLDYLLDDPKAAVAYFTRDLPPQRTAKSANHLYGLRQTIYGLICQVTDQLLFDLLVQDYPLIDDDESDSDEEEEKEAAEIKTCVMCGKQFPLTEGEKRYMLGKGYPLPKRCKPCRSNKNKR
eukprot:TRINITY_DN1796_c0_g1_i5.p1 TRINITY_DN1796_c0_g1~~TRINITY_DN1796_c0_g1_i5.p1  ORF type:complete len:382 (-),score=99.52 TRINITY_DN1796_c0_g1_i5:68-1213(-)